MPCKMELKIKDYERFKAYYCGLCKSIRDGFGQIPRISLNYDMTFLALLLDSFDGEPNKFVNERCIVHPIKKRICITSNSALEYAAFCNVTLAYFKLMDNIQDDHKIKDRFYSLFLRKHIKDFDKNQQLVYNQVKNKIAELNQIESSLENYSIDSYSHPFAELTGFILSSFPQDESSKNDLYWLGYNLGKWIYVIDAWDDLKRDMVKEKFNAVNSAFNRTKLPFETFKAESKDRVEFTLLTCAQQSLACLRRLPLKKNQALLENILQYGIMEKMDKVFNMNPAVEKNVSTEFM